VFDALGEADLAEGSVRLGVLCRAVLPRLVAAYERHLDRARPVADQPAMRALRLVLADERAAIARGTELLDGEVGVVAEAQRLDACERFEDILGGTPAGLVPWTDD
jgi:hypothetical protein